jgi:hypothetical protein
MKKVYILFTLLFTSFYGYSQTKNNSSKSDFLNEFFNDLKFEFHLKDTVLTTFYNTIDTLSFIHRDTLDHFMQYIDKPIKYVVLEKGEREELNKNFNYNIDFSQIQSIKFIVAPIDTIRSINLNNFNKEKRIAAFIEKYKTQDYYIFSEPLLLRDENYCFFEYEIGSFFKPHTSRESTIFKKIDGRWKEWIIFSWKHTF